MLIWRGKGIFALLIAVLINLIINESSNAYFGIPEGFHHYRDAHQWVWLLSMGLLVSGIVGGGRYLEECEAFT